ncbi:unnamed protein product [Mytilus coruscus]|uniref:Uncharacterized protein n=1 Tax=Mytilus coruscus TaxID=42192 RepID=A0A6J8BLY7_MYTCO|nr:unnamed protein product [Mytilus coruscus]
MRESAAGNVSLMTERIEKLSEVLEKTNSEKLPKLEVDLQAASRDIDSTLKSIQQVIEDKKDIKTTEYEDYKKLQDMDIKRELKRRENVLTEYRNLYNSIEKMLAEDHADIDDFDEEILKDIDLPHVPEFESESFVEEIVHAISAKFELRLPRKEDTEEDKRRIVKLMEENVTLQQNIRELKTMVSSTSNSQQQEVRQLKLELNNIRLSTNTVEHQQEIRQLKHEYTSKRLSNNTDGHQQEIRQLNQEFSSTRVKDSSHISELTKQKEVLEQKTRKLEEEVQDLKNRLSDNTDGHLQENHQLKQELSSTRTNAKGHVSQLQSQKDDLEQKTRNLEKESQDLKNRGELSAKLFELTNQNKGMEQTAKEREEQNLNNRIYWAEQSQTEAHRQIEGYKQEASKANTTIQTYQQQITGYKEEASKANTTIQTYQQQIEGYRRQVLPFIILQSGSTNKILLNLY